jgi:hypothetical protein
LWLAGERLSYREEAMPTDGKGEPAADEHAAASWPDELFSAAVERIAVVTARLLAQPAAWVHRRVETITFLDDIRIRRHMSVDFTLPTLGLAIEYVPLSLVRKGLLKDLDVVDEEGRALPVLTLGQSAEVAAYILRTQAPREQHVDDSVWIGFRDVAGAARPSGRGAPLTPSQPFGTRSRTRARRPSASAISFGTTPS